MLLRFSRRYWARYSRLSIAQCCQQILMQLILIAQRTKIRLCFNVHATHLLRYSIVYKFQYYVFINSQVLRSTNDLLNRQICSSVITALRAFNSERSAHLQQMFIEKQHFNKHALLWRLYDNCIFYVYYFRVQQLKIIQDKITNIFS